MPHYRWILPTPPPKDHPAFGMGFSPLVTQLLANRGLDTAEQIQAYLKDFPLDYDPFLLPDMHSAVQRVRQALAAGESICVYGDFDVDGITSTALLVQGLTALGGRVMPYIPHRTKEGYGLRSPALHALREQGVSLVISVDCGISALREVREANEMGLDVIITDHHAIPPEIPPAVAAINPKRADSKYPFDELAGVGVALKLLQAIGQSAGKPSLADSASDLVALGTIADMAPLRDENRYLVRRGLRQLNESPRPGIAEMMTQTRFGRGIDTECVSFGIAPRLNAAGRIDHAMNGYKLLTAASSEEARELVGWLEQKNSERQEMTSRFSNMAKEQARAKGVPPLLLVSGPDYPIGVAGLVASRLAEEYYRPAVVVESGEISSRGSCRSIPEFNIVRALDECRHLLGQYGGHAQAAGFTIPTENLAGLEARLVEIAAAQLAGVDLRPRLNVDVTVNLQQLGGNAYNALQKLAPFGMANPEPSFLSRNVELLNCRQMGGEGAHLKMKLRQGKTVWDGVAFGLGAYLCEAAPAIDIVYNLSVDRWNGQEKLRLTVLDFAACGSYLT